MRAPGGVRGARPLHGRETRRQRKPCHNGRRPIPAKSRCFRERSQDRALQGRPRCGRCRLRCPYIGCAEDDSLRHPAHVRHVWGNNFSTDSGQQLFCSGVWGTAYNRSDWFRILICGRFWYVVVPCVFQIQSACIFGFILRIFGRIFQSGKLKQWNVCIYGSK